MKKELFDEVCVDFKEDSTVRAKLSYYLLTDNVSEEFCDLKVYGVEIDKTEENKKGNKIKEKKIIRDLFFKKNEAIEFLQNISEQKVTPMGLKHVVKDYIGERIQLCNKNKM